MKKVLRRSPEPLKELAVKALRAMVDEPKKPRPKPPTPLEMSPELIGETYAPEDVLGMIALEHHAMELRLEETIDRLNFVREQLSELQQKDNPVAEPDRSETDSDEPTPSSLAEEYLAGQPEAPVRHLVIANDYPRVGREYGNGFVHRRVKHYQSQGVAVDVVLAGYSVEQDLYEYDGVRVLSGKGAEITEVLQRQRYRSVSAHFMNELMWNGLQPMIDEIELHVFLHGYECSRWVRRLGNYARGIDLERAVDRTIGLRRFWRMVVEHESAPASYIFVSDWWRRAVADDMGVLFPEPKTHVVHNFIDTDLFRYVPKDDAQRFRLLWVRSAAQRNYGNDLAIETLLKLSEQPEWSKCEATIIGDGQFFPEFEEKLGHLPNVRIEQRFASQDEIADLHKKHGIFLVPSRLDTQGVSRDEAMASGLVVTTNLVAAIPEFVDENTGIVAKAEDSASLAEGIMNLWRNPDEFQRLSRAASARTKAQCGRAATIEREMRILGLIDEEGH